MSYDPKCEELACHFLKDFTQHMKAHDAELAQVIQDSVEDWFRMHATQSKKQWRQLGPEHDEYIDKQPKSAFVK